MREIQITAAISRGPFKGAILVPHLHNDATYVVSRTRFSKDYRYVRSFAEVLQALDQGLSLRMSPLNLSIAPSLVSANSISVFQK